MLTFISRVIENVKKAAVEAESKLESKSAVISKEWIAIRQEGLGQ